MNKTIVPKSTFNFRTSEEFVHRLEVVAEKTMIPKSRIIRALIEIGMDQIELHAKKSDGLTLITKQLRQKGALNV